MTAGKCVENDPKCPRYNDGECTVDFGEYPDEEYFTQGGVRFFCPPKEKPEEIKKWKLPKRLSISEQKADKHWEWLEKFLHDLGVDVEQAWGVIYKNAFHHGFGHGYEVAKQESE